MQYRKDKYGNELSVLGFGCMRFQRKGARIDMEEMEKEVLLSIEKGVNYFDTAYIYPGSEAALGQVLEKTGMRDRVYIASKLPHYLIKNKEGLEKLFQEELRRLRTDHIDYYLMHMLNDIRSWERLKALGIEAWLSEKKASGAIRQVGFSYHGNTDMFLKVLDAWDWEFCQIQYNYLDEHSQAGRRGLNRAAEKGIPVVIMEPLRGGRLVGLLPQKAKELFDGYPVTRSYAEWGLRWLWNQKEVTVVLSGMNTLEMVEENCRIASRTEAGAVTAEEEALYTKVVEAIHESVKVGCTACGYCQPCPKGVDIPGAFAAYNRWHGENKTGAFMDYLKGTLLRKDPAAVSCCIGCGKCEAHCPQNIPIRQELENVKKTLETPLYKVIRKGMGVFTKF